MSTEQQTASTGPDDAVILPAAYNVAGIILGCEQVMIERARQFERAGSITELRALCTVIDLDAPNDRVYAAATGGMQAILTGMLILIDRLADAPGPCGRYNAHTAHGNCPGTAPEYPSDQVETIGNDYERAVNRVEQATARLWAAEQEVSDANDECLEADQALARLEAAPGIPLDCRS